MHRYCVFRQKMIHYERIGSVYFNSIKTNSIRTKMKNENIL